MARKQKTAKKQKTKENVLSFRTENSKEVLDEFSYERFGYGINKSAQIIVDDILLLDVDDVYDARIFSVNRMMDDIKSKLNLVISEKENMQKRMDDLTELEKKLNKKISEIESEKEVYIAYQKKEMKISISKIINKMLLIYVKEDVEFDECVMQELILSSKSNLNQDLIINNIQRYLDKNMYKSISIKHDETDDDNDYKIHLDEKTVKQMKNLLYKLRINKK